MAELFAKNETKIGTNGNCTRSDAFQVRKGPFFTPTRGPE